MEKCLKIRFPNGDLFAVPTRIIAEDRANYYSTIDGYEIGSNDWEKEVEYALNDEYEIKDWVANNMDWPDLEGYSKLIEEDKEEFDYEDSWSDVEINFCDESEND